ncbi:hypothetical protein HPB50_014306 [Hyalomma asiaticum]|uniref:Uncharacterized protein n=1 Tax=Hyalomma asiaticum TaxID=266040 RepID=A0ACB7T201_HYAAI|nr:hypothetical protein HPB50_014306 [Hyalomma asiaticum]
MGVRDLWEVLSPVARKVQLDDLRGKRLAVDLSGWIVESEQMRAKMHEPVIRNRDASGCVMAIDFCSKNVGTLIECDQICADGYDVGNLISADRRHCGFMAEYFIKPPVSVVLTLPCPIELSCIAVGLTRGPVKLTGFEIWASHTGVGDTAARDDFVLIGRKFGATGEVFLLRNRCYVPRGPFASLMRDGRSPSFAYDSRGTGETLKNIYSKHVCRLKLRLIRAVGSSSIGLGSLQVWGQPMASLCSLAAQEELIRKFLSPTDTVPHCSRENSATDQRRSPSAPAILDQAKPLQTEGAAELGGKVSTAEFQIPTDFQDALTFELMTQPVLLPSGQVVDQSTLDKHVETDEKWGRPATDPFTGVKLAGVNGPKSLPELKSRIDHFVVRNLDKLGNIPRTLGRSHSATTRPSGLISLSQSERPPSCQTLSESTASSSTKDCRELLDSLGLPYVQSTGEAEKTCAFLDKNEDPHVLSYKISDIESKLSLDRERLVALAVLAGCDYFAGVRSVGKETAVKLLSKFRGTGPLERLRDWTRDSKYSKLQETLDRNCKKPSHCGNCQHLGMQRSHRANGCDMCCTEASCTKSVISNCTCEWHKAEDVKNQWRTELDIRKKALDEYDEFPPEDVISEFLTDQDDFQSINSAWQFPSAKKFEDLMLSKMSWEPYKSREKLFPLLTRCHLEQGGNSCEEVSTLKPVKIVKERVQRNVDFYEVEWLATELWAESSPPNTLEPQELFESVYPELVKAFDDERSQKSKKKPVITDGTKSDIRGYFTVSSGKSQNVVKDESEGTGMKKPEKNAAVVTSKKNASPTVKSRSVTTRARKPKSPPPKATKTVDHYFERSPKFSAKPLDVSLDSSLDAFNVPLSERIARAAQKPAVHQPTSPAGGVASEEPGKSPEPMHVASSKSSSVLEESVIVVEKVACRSKEDAACNMTLDNVPSLSELACISASLSSLPDQKLDNMSLQENLTSQPYDKMSRSPSPTSADLSKPAKSALSEGVGVPQASTTSTVKDDICGTDTECLKSDTKKPSWPASFNLSISDSLKAELMTSMQLSCGEVDDRETDIGCTPAKRRRLSSRKSIVSPSEKTPDRLAGGDAVGDTSTTHASSSSEADGSHNRRSSGRRRLSFSNIVTSTPVLKECLKRAEVKVERLSEEMLASFKSQGVITAELESEESYDCSGPLFDSKGESLELSEKNRQSSVIVISDDDDNC